MTSKTAMHGYAEPDQLRLSPYGDSDESCDNCGRVLLSNEELSIRLCTRCKRELYEEKVDWN